MSDLFVIVEWRRWSVGASPAPHCPGELYDSAEDAQEFVDRMVEDIESGAAGDATPTEFSIYRLVEVSP